MRKDERNIKSGGGDLDGQLNFGNELFGLGPGKKKKELEPATVLDDSSFLFVPPEEDREEEEDKDDWPLGEG